MTADAVVIPESQEEIGSAGGDDYTVLAAHVAGAHGVGGNVRLRMIGANAEIAAESLRASRVVKAADENHTPPRLLTVASLRRLSGAKSGWTVHFREITSRTDAETLVGHSLYIQEANRVRLADGEYYVDQILGLAMATDTGHDLGNIVEVLHSPGNDVYVSDKDILVPAVAVFILETDLENRRVTVRDVLGLREGT